MAGPPGDRPVILYDGDCPFCVRWTERYRNVFGESIEFQPSAEGASRFPEIPAEVLAGAVQLVEVDGLVYSGADAVTRALARKPGHGWVLWCYAYIPGLAWAARKAYGWVARRRGRL